MKTTRHIYHLGCWTTGPIHIVWVLFFGVVVGCESPQWFIHVAGNTTLGLMAARAIAAFCRFYELPKSLPTGQANTNWSIQPFPFPIHPPPPPPTKSPSISRTSIKDLFLLGLPKWPHNECEKWKRMQWQVSALNTLQQSDKLKTLLLQNANINMTA